MPYSPKYGTNPKPQRSGTPKKRSRLLDALLLVCILAALFSGWKLLEYYVLLPKQNEQVMTDLKNLIQPPVSSEGSAPQSASALAFQKLKEVNPDIKAWLTLPGTVIDYPVLQSGTDDPEYYLYRNYKKEDSNHGSIFLDSRAQLEESACLPVYGHSMNDGQMFRALLDLDLAKLQANPTVTLTTERGDETYEIFSLLRTNVRSDQGPVFNYIRTSFSDNSDFMNFAYQLAIRSEYQCGVDVQPGDQLLLLSTCSYEFEDFRTVLVVRKLREGEQKPDGKAITQRTDTLYPDCWYWANGGSAPSWPETYEDAAEQGRLPW